MQAVEHIISKYPNYVSLKALEKEFVKDNAESRDTLFGLMNELAYLQVLIVK